MASHQKFKIALALFALVICITQVQQTYAKYLEKRDGDTDFDIASWKITVNNQDISEATTMSSLINPVYLDNENVAEGVIAPGSAGYFDLDIDASQTEVSFSYSVSASASDNSSVTDLIITGYKLNDSDIIDANGSAVISNNLYYNNPIKNVSLRIYFKWNDGTGETMDNSADTSAALSGESAKLRVNLTFTQIAN